MADAWRKQILADYLGWFDLAWGFECEDGWAPIIAQLTAKIAAVIPKEKHDQFRIAQVKEKMGGLRYYTHFDLEDEALVKKISDLIRSAENASFVTCERCGLPGNLASSHGWWSVRCEECRK